MEIATRRPMLDTIRGWVDRHPKWSLTLVTLAALLPFLAKPFNIDDPLFIWTARQIQAHPADPYGFNVEWGFREFPMAKVTENPPLACYYIALAALIFGWSEVGLHAAFLLPAIAAVVGTYRLARHFCRSPALAAAATLFTPVFLVSCTTVMCDVLMLAFWVWAAAFWVEGIEGKNLGALAGSALLVSLGILTKYYALCLVPLLAAHGLIATRRPGRWALCLLIPLAVAGIYEWITSSMYGKGLFAAAAHYASFGQGSKLPAPSACLIGLAFTGGCLASAVFFAPLLWRTTPRLPAVAGVFIIVAILVARTAFQKYPSLDPGFRIAVEIQLILWATAGLIILALALADLRRQPDAQSWLLALWVGGTFLFAALVNWTINGRSILPMAPAVAILLVRRLERQNSPRPRGTAICLAGAAIVALLVTTADYGFARASRSLSEQVIAKYGKTSQRLWFQGHWGFQFYMQDAGALPVDYKNSALNIGDLVAVPSNNTNILPPDPTKSVLIDTLSANGLESLATMERAVGAGFYSSVWGPLPFSFGRVPPERVTVFQLKPPALPTPESSR